MEENNIPQAPQPTPPVSPVAQPASPPPSETVSPKPSNKILLLFGVVMLLVFAGIFIYFVSSNPSQIKSSQTSSEPTAVEPSKTSTSKTLLIPVTSAKCGKLEQSTMRDADYKNLLTEECELSLISKKDASFFELKHTISSGPNVSDAILVNFDIGDEIESSKIISSKIIMENVWCNNALMIRYSSMSSYNQLAYYGENEKGFTYDCGQNTPKNFAKLELEADVINGSSSAVISPYSTTYPVKIDNIYLEIMY